MFSFSVIIVSWNALEHVKTFLPGVTETDYPDFEIIFADNASTDGSVEWIRAHHPEVKIVSLDKNYGYCGGNNRGAMHATGDITVFLNNDVKVEPDWLTHLNSCFGRNPDWAAIQPKMRSYKEPEKFEYAGAAGGFIDRFGYPLCRGRIFDTLEKDTGQYDNHTDLFWASGAALAIRTELFYSLQGFDEDFEFHMEEIDLCWRLWNRGYKIGFCPESVVYHLGGGSLPTDSSRKVYYNYRNNLIMLIKNLDRTSLWSRLPFRILLDVVASIQMLITGNFRNTAAVFRAYFHFLLRLTSTLKKRRKLQRERQSPGNPPHMLPESIVWQYFIRGKKTFNEIAGKRGS